MKRIIGIIALALAAGLSAKAQTTDNMDRIEVCKQNYRTLFGGEALTGQGTDPEMMDILQKFIFGEVFQTGGLTLKQREMITHPGGTARGDVPHRPVHRLPQDAECRLYGE